MLVPHHRYLPPPIEVLEDLEDVSFTASTLDFDTLGNIHVHVELDIGLRKGQYQVHLTCTPSVDDLKDYHHTNGEPSHER